MRTFFPVRVNPFQKGVDVQEIKQEATKGQPSFCLIMSDYTLHTRPVIYSSDLLSITGLCAGLSLFPVFLQS